MGTRPPTESTKPSLPEPVSPMTGITRWHVDDGTIVADSVTGTPGVHFYARTEGREITNPTQLAAALVAAQHLINKAGN